MHSFVYIKKYIPKFVGSLIITVDAIIYVL